MNIVRPTIAAVATALILAPSAHADPTDDMNYIQELYAMGMDRTTLHAPTPQVACGENFRRPQDWGRHVAEAIYETLEVAGVKRKRRTAQR